MKYIALTLYFVIIGISYIYLLYILFKDCKRLPWTEEGRFVTKKTAIIMFVFCISIPILIIILSNN